MISRTSTPMVVRVVIARSPRTRIRMAHGPLIVHGFMVNLESRISTYLLREKRHGVGCGCPGERRNRARCGGVWYGDVGEILVAAKYIQVTAPKIGTRPSPC